MLNHVCEGKSLIWTNNTGSAVLAGDPVLIGSNILGVAVADIAISASGAVAIKEVFDIRKANGAITQGVKLYWDADGNPQGGATGIGCLTTSSSGNTYAGIAHEAAGITDETVAINLNV